MSLDYGNSFNTKGYSTGGLLEYKRMKDVIDIAQEKLNQIKEFEEQIKAIKRILKMYTKHDRASQKKRAEKIMKEYKKEAKRKKK